MSENAKNYYFWNEAAFERAIKRHVCPHCRFFSRNGRRCINSEPLGCALMRRMPDLVRIAQRMERCDPSAYIEAVEEQVSFHCASADRGDVCARLDSPRCGLDALLPFVLEAVIKTDATLESRRDPD